MFVVILLLALPIVSLAVLSATSQRLSSLGVREGRLAPCPASPNCVSTQAEDDAHRIAPIVYRSSKEDALRGLKSVLASWPRVTIVSEGPDYLHAEFRSVVFRFVDDVEFFIAPGERVIHFRSASRVGHSDLGVNRRRMELIREQFTEAAAATIPSGQ
ncbi:MAG TPA: DUF1499 domain-containing protein [Planctomycetaceae bacterium]|nr:DUF1499 domain-containing protein [Planctomycetaceae bacterium]